MQTFPLPLCQGIRGFSVTKQKKLWGQTAQKPKPLKSPRKEPAGPFTHGVRVCFLTQRTQGPRSLFSRRAHSHTDICAH